jgi:hypothetical protein
MILATAFALFVLLTASWEWKWRQFGAIPGSRDDSALWARERRRIDAGEGNATVLIGASRTFFDVQLPVWERLSGHRPIQLAVNGTSPRFVLEDLANDPAFTGRLLIGIAPDVFFTGFEYNPGLGKYTRKETPSQRAGKVISMNLVEPWLAFYDQDYALLAVLRRQPWPERAGLGGLVPRKLGIVGPDRNNYMWSKLDTDADYRTLLRTVWAQDFNDPPPSAQEAAENKRIMDEQVAHAAAAVARLRARNVPVIFVRDPSAGAYLDFENRDFPRRSTWDVLLKATGAPGIYFEDYKELQGYELPEWSHLNRQSAERYTAALYRILERDFAPADGTRW